MELDSVQTVRQEKAKTEWKEVCRKNVRKRAELMAENVGNPIAKMTPELLALIKHSTIILRARPYGISEIEAIQLLTVTPEEMQPFLKV
jgi:hypothetical protein